MHGEFCVHSSGASGAPHRLAPEPGIIQRVTWAGADPVPGVRRCTKLCVGSRFGECVVNTLFRSSTATSETSNPRVVPSLYTVVWQLDPGHFVGSVSTRST